MRIGSGTVLTVIALWALASSLVAAEEPDFVIRNLAWTGQPTSEAHLVDVFNPYGDIRVRPSESPDIVVSGVVQELTPDQPRADLHVDQQGETTTIRILLAERVEKFPGRVDLVVLLPTHVDVTARAIDGTIRTKSIRGHVSARTRSGEIIAIFKKLTRDKGNGRTSAIVLETETGDIEASFLVDTDLRVHATTGGTIQTLIPNDLVEGIRQYTGILTGSMGSGRNPITIRSASGTVKLQIPNASNPDSGDGGVK